MFSFHRYAVCLFLPCIVSTLGCAAPSTRPDAVSSESALATNVVTLAHRVGAFVLDEQDVFFARFDDQGVCKLEARPADGSADTRGLWEDGLGFVISALTQDREHLYFAVET